MDVGDHIPDALAAVGQEMRVFPTSLGIFRLTRSPLSRISVATKVRGSVLGTYMV
jgi:hypothetical protein